MFQIGDWVRYRKPYDDDGLNGTLQQGHTYLVAGYVREGYLSLEGQTSEGHGWYWARFDAAEAPNRLDPQAQELVEEYRNVQERG